MSFICAFMITGQSIHGMNVMDTLSRQYKRSTNLGTTTRWVLDIDKVIIPRLVEAEGTDWRTTVRERAHDSPLNFFERIILEERYIAEG